MGVVIPFKRKITWTKEELVLLDNYHFRVLIMIAIIKLRITRMALDNLGGETARC